MCMAEEKVIQRPKARQQIFGGEQVSVGHDLYGVRGCWVSGQPGHPLVGQRP
jgi:hypothetical protein